MFDIIAIGKRLVADIRGMDVAAALRDVGELLPKVADLYEALRSNLFMAPPPETKTEFDALLAELDAAVAQPVVAGAGSGAASAINFDRVLAIIQKVQDLLKLIKELT